MKFKPTEYKLKNVASGRIFEDAGWTLSDPESPSPSLVRAVYSNKQFTPREELPGLYRYADWMPIKRILKHSEAPVSYHSKGLGKALGLDNLYITFSGWCPRIGAEMPTCSFKETEAYSVLARMGSDEKRILVLQSAGNTGRAFLQVCSDNNIPLAVCVPFDNLHNFWFRKALNSCVKLIAVLHGFDYYDAIRLGEKLFEDDSRYFPEGGAKNVARRDGMGTTLLSAVEEIGRIPDAYFQAVGSGTGAIAAWENNLRLIEDGRFGTHKMRLYISQNAPFSLLYDSWKSGKRELADLDPELGRRQSEVILAKVLSNRKPPYGVAGGLYDALADTNGDAFTATNDQIVHWIMRVRELEGYFIDPAAASAVQALASAVKEGKVKKDEIIMLNCTGGGSIEAMEQGYVHKEPDLILDPDLSAEEVIKRVSALF